MMKMMIALWGLLLSVAIGAQQLPHHELQQISAGYKVTCATSEWHVAWCWGRGENGQVGNGSTYEKMPLPEKVLIHFKDAQFVSSGSKIGCGMNSRGELWCWGGIYGAYRGNPRAGKGILFSTATQIKEPTDITAIATGATHTCALTKEGAVWCWGGGRAGETGNPSYAWVNKKPRKIEGLPPAKQVATGLIHSCALTTAGEVWCWGGNRYGQLADPNPKVSRSAQARPVPHLPSGIVAIRGGMGNATCALTASHEAWCWGAGGMGQLGNGAKVPRQDVPVKVQGISQIKDLTLGYQHACAIDGNDEAWCWGSGGHGELGHGQYEESLVPVKVQGSLKVAQLSAGYYSTCAIRAHGPKAYCWGSNEDGQLGVGAEPTASAVPLPVSFPPIDRR